MSVHLPNGMCVVITGGTRGFGRATAIEFARAGARVVVTHRWGSADEEELTRSFEALRGGPPWIVESDAGDPAAVRDLMRAVRERYGRLDAVIVNTAVAKVTHDLNEMKRSSFELSLKYSAWPIVDLVQAAYEEFGRYPPYVIGVSSQGVDSCYPGYDLAGASKAALETFCRYLAVRLRSHGVRVNAVRPGFLDTASSRATCGDDEIERLRVEGLVLAAEGAAKVCVALCSGWLDAISGQVITADEGLSLRGPVMPPQTDPTRSPSPPQFEGADHDER